MRLDRQRRRLLQAMAAGAVLAPLNGIARSCLGEPDPDPQVSAGFTSLRNTWPVGWVYSADYQCTGTCFLIADNWIASAAHVIEDSVQAASRVVVFNYTADERACQRDAYVLSPDDHGYIRSDPESDLDFCLVRVEPKKGRLPGKIWGTLPLDRAAPAVANEPALLIHHPDRRIAGSAYERHAQHYKCSSASYIVPRSKPDSPHRCVHSACAEEGSSGAPLMTLDGRLVGIHSRQKLDETGEQVPGCWIATSAMSIVDSLREEKRRKRLTSEQAALIRLD